jgi:putative multiple sugar transport system substrate-binding protein
MKSSSVILSALLLAANGIAAPAADLSVGIVLPTKDQTRWLQDEVRFQALKAAGYNIEILWSQNDPAKEKANVESLLTKGAKVIILCAVDSAAAAASANEAHASGAKVIAYDRLIMNTANVDFYVTFDSVQVGEAWGKYLVGQAKGKGNNLYLYAGAASDNNAFLFFQGAWNYLQPKIADGTFVVKNSSEAVALKGKAKLDRADEAKIIGQVTTNWSFNDAKSKAEANLTAVGKSDKGNVFVLGPNDDTSRAIGDVFAIDKDVTHYFITGQDAEPQSIQYIIDGKQSMTVLKDTRTLVSDAIKASVGYLKGQKPAQTTTYDNGKAQIAAKPTAIVTVTKENVKQTIFESGYYKITDYKNVK